MGIKLVCKNCGGVYEVQKHRKNSKFCCKECYTLFQKSTKNKLRKRKIIICKNCGNEKEILNYQKSEFCCRKCYWEYRKNNPDIIIQSNQKKVRYNKVCENCNKEYDVHHYRVDTTRFCSSECYDEYRRETIICPTCKQSFTVPKKQERKYCSEDCFSKGVDKRQSKFSLSIESFLKRNNYKYITEFKIKNDSRKVYVDFLIENQIVIECYGDYWHCNPIKYSEGYFHVKIQKHAVDIWEKDYNRIKFIENEYQTIVIWENEWREDKNKLFNKIEDKLREKLCNTQK